MTGEETIRQLEEKRDSVIAFLSSWIHQQYLAGVREALAENQELLDSIRIRSDEDIYLHLELSAKKDLLTACLSDFEGMVSNLDHRIEEILRSVQPNETQQLE